MNLVDELVAIARVLEEAGVPYAICGGVAVTLHGHVRSTKDIDLLVLEQDVERILELLRPTGWRFVGLPIVFERGTERERRLQRVSKIVDERVLTLDLLVVGPVFAEVWASRIVVPGPEVTLSVVSLEGLQTMKRLAGRKQDLADLEHLDGDAEE